MNAKILQAIIESATKQDLLQPDRNMNNKCCEAINSKLDLPKEAVKFLRKRVGSRNPKVQLLALQLVDTALSKCGLPFQTALATPQFMQTLINIINTRQEGHEVSRKILVNIQKWALHFEKHKDILPLFADIYLGLKQKGLPFPDQHKAASASASYPSRPSGSAKESSHSSAPKVEVKRPTDPKAWQTVAQLQLVKSNIILTNDMITQSDHRRPRPDQVLTDLVTALKQMEGKLIELISTASDQYVTNAALMMNDNLQQTLTRYNQLKNHQKPAPWNNTFQNESQQTEKKSQEIPKEEKKQYQFQNFAPPASAARSAIRKPQYQKKKSIQQARAAPQPPAPAVDLINFDDNSAPQNPPKQIFNSQHNSFNFANANSQQQQQNPASDPNDPFSFNSQPQQVVQQSAPAPQPQLMEQQQQQQPSTGFDPFNINIEEQQNSHPKAPGMMTDAQIQNISNPMQKLNAIVQKKQKLKQQEEQQKLASQQQAMANAANAFNTYIPALGGGGMNPSMPQNPGYYNTNMANNGGFGMPGYGQSPMPYAQYGSNIGGNNGFPSGGGFPAQNPQQTQPQMQPMNAGLGYNMQQQPQQQQQPPKKSDDFADLFGNSMNIAPSSSAQPSSSSFGMPQNLGLGGFPNTSMPSAPPQQQQNLLGGGGFDFMNSGQPAVAQQQPMQMQQQQQFQPAKDQFADLFG